MRSHAAGRRARPGAPARRRDLHELDAVRVAPALQRRERRVDLPARVDDQSDPLHRRDPIRRAASASLCRPADRPLGRGSLALPAVATRRPSGRRPVQVVRSVKPPRQRHTVLGCSSSAVIYDRVLEGPAPAGPSCVSELDVERLEPVGEAQRGVDGRAGLACVTARPTAGRPSRVAIASARRSSAPPMPGASGWRKTCEIHGPPNGGSPRLPLTSTAPSTAPSSPTASPLQRSSGPSRRPGDDLLELELGLVGVGDVGEVGMAGRDRRRAQAGARSIAGRSTGVRRTPSGAARLEPRRRAPGRGRGRATSRARGGAARRRRRRAARRTARRRRRASRRSSRRATAAARSRATPSAGSNRSASGGRRARARSKRATVGAVGVDEQPAAPAAGSRRRRASRQRGTTRARRRRARRGRRRSPRPRAGAGWRGGRARTRRGPRAAASRS